MIKRLLALVLVCSSLSKSYSQQTYQFTGSLSGTGPTLVERLDPTCSVPGTAGSFGTQTITISTGTGGLTQQVFQFNANDGISYTNATGAGGLGITNSYTIHILYKINEYNTGGTSFSFQRLINFKPSSSTSDDGLYTNGDNGTTTPPPASTARFVNVLAGAPSGATPNIPNISNYHLISLVRNFVANQLDLYIDGSPAASYADAGGVYTSNGADSIIFFRDDVAAPFPCESGAGAVRYLSLSNTAANATQVNNTFLALSAIVLPVSLTDFSAQKNTNSIALQWKVSNESNAAYYNIEKSVDGVNFTAIGKVDAKNISSSTYAYNDASAISLTSGYTYYRLKSVDVNGNFKYSSIVKIANGKESKITLFPNPATNFVTISGLNNKDEIRLLSIDGKILSQQTNTGAQSMIMSVEKYKPGTYIIQVKNDTEVSQQKFVKY